MAAIFWRFWAVETEPAAMQTTVGALFTWINLPGPRSNSVVSVTCFQLGIVTYYLWTVSRLHFSDSMWFLLITSSDIMHMPGSPSFTWFSPITSLPMPSLVSRMNSCTLWVSICEYWGHKYWGQSIGRKSTFHFIKWGLADRIPYELSGTTFLYRDGVV